MQVNKIAAVCALACAAMAGSAQAAITKPADLDAALAAGRVISISGASAVQKGFASMIAGMFTGTPVFFANSNSAVSGGDYVGVAGELASGNGDWSGQTVVIVYRTKGGSVYGVNSVARATPIESLNVASTCSGSDIVDPVTGLVTTHVGSSARPYSCGLVNRAPDAGVSDVAPALFQSPINTEGETAAEALSLEELAVLSPAPIYGLGFGVAATANLTDIKLNRATIASIMVGNTGTWNAVDPSESGDIIVCRRTPGSGTQAVYNMHFGNYPCTATVNTPADREASGAWNGTARKFTVNGGNSGVVVIENGSSGDVRKCLANAYDAAKATAPGVKSYSTTDRNGKPVTVEFKNQVAHKAIGLLSMDSLNEAQSTGKWQFRSLDGAGRIYSTINNATDKNILTVEKTGDGKFPTIDSIVDGTWDLMGMISFNIPTGRVDNDQVTPPVVALSQAKLDVLNSFLASAQKPETLDSVNALKYVAASVAGTVGTGKVMGAAYVGGDQCAPYMR